MTGSAADLGSECHRLLVAHRATVATGESLTGGLLGAALTREPGTSATYRGGVVAYDPELKVSLLAVPAAALDRDGPVHPATARAMAAGAQDRLGATYGVATTGVAGPDPHGDRPVGTVYVAVAGPGGGSVGEAAAGDMPAVRRLDLEGDRDRIREDTVVAALGLLRDVLAAVPGPCPPPADGAGGDRHSS